MSVQGVMNTRLGEGIGTMEANAFVQCTAALLSAIPLPDPQYEKQRQRITYNPLAEHDYSVEGPTMREITPGHFIYCNGAEFEKYKEELGL